MSEIAQFEKAQYRGTGKRKTSVARVILRPGDGATWVNGKTLEEYFPRPTHRKLALAPYSVAKALSVDVRHGEPEAGSFTAAADLAGVVHRDDVGMLQTGSELDFAEKAVGTDSLSQLRMEHLECDWAIVAQVLRQIHDRHPTAAELALDAIVGRQLSLETIQAI